MSGDPVGGRPRTGEVGRPELEVTWSEAPEKPTNLNPSGGRGIYVVRPKAPTYTPAGEVITVCDLMDKSDVCAATQIGRDLTLPRGKVIIGDQISAPGEVLYQIGQSGEFGLNQSVDFIANYAKLAAPLAFEAGTGRLAIINRILSAINYWALDIDAEGRFQVWPYREPRARYNPADAWRLEDGTNCIYRGDVRVDQEIDVPNQLTVVARGAGVDQIAYTARNASGDCGPYATSYAARGRWVSPRDGAITVEAESQSRLVEIGRRMLIRRQAPGARLTVAMDWRPTMVGNSVGTFTLAGHYSDALAVVVGISEEDDVAADMVVTLEMVQ